MGWTSTAQIAPNGKLLGNQYTITSKGSLTADECAQRQCNLIQSVPDGDATNRSLLKLTKDQLTEMFDFLKDFAKETTIRGISEGGETGPGTTRLIVASKDGWRAVMSALGEDLPRISGFMAGFGAKAIGTAGGIVFEIGAANFEPERIELNWTFLRVVKDFLDGKPSSLGAKSLDAEGNAAFSGQNKPPGQ